MGGEGNDLADLCRDWEASAQLPTDSPTRLVTVRIGKTEHSDATLVSTEYLAPRDTYSETSL